MRNRAIATLVGTCALGSCALVAVGAGDERTLAFTTNVRVVRPVVHAQPDESACQAGLQAAAAFDSLELVLGTGAEPGPPLEVVVRRSGSRRPLATGSVPGGATDDRPVPVRLDREVPEGAAIDVCARNRGAREVGFYGGPWYESPGVATVDGRPADGDIRILFLRSEPRSALAQVPDMFERAARFRPGLVGAWAFWALLVAVAAGIPALLGLALRDATRT